MLRTFLAIELPVTVRNRIGEVQKDLKSLNADVRWVNPENIHLTLKFFGNIEKGTVGPIIESIDEPARATPPFFIKVHGVGAFPSSKNPRVIWMGLREGKEVLISFQRWLEKEIEKIGFRPEDRPFHPHLTLGRTRGSLGREGLVERLERLKEEVFGDFHVEKVILFKSDLRPTGPIYTPLKEVRLGGERVGR